MPGIVRAMTDTTDVPGGAAPGEPSPVLYRTLTEDGVLLGALWAAEAPLADGVQGGLTTHLVDVPPRLAWLAQGVVNGLRMGADAEAVLAEVAGMGGGRWRLSGTTSVAATIGDARAALAALAAPAAPATDPGPAAAPDAPAPAPAPARKAATKKAAK